MDMKYSGNCITQVKLVCFFHKTGHCTYWGCWYFDKIYDNVSPVMDNGYKWCTDTGGLILRYSNGGCPQVDGERFQNDWMMVTSRYACQRSTECYDCIYIRW